MKLVKFLFVFALFSVCLTSCESETDDPGRYDKILSGNGALIINEGNYNGGNSSLSFYSFDSLEIYNDLFEQINGRPLGDVAQSLMPTVGNKAYIIVNNSNKIEIVNLATLESIRTIQKLNSPRYAEKVSSVKAYVTSMYSDSVAIVDIRSDKVTGYINVRRSSESILATGTKAFVANWIGGNEVMVINTLTNKVIDSIAVSEEPESMVLDRNNVLWVLCNGGWMRENYARLFAINTTTNAVIRSFQFPLITDSPVNLTSNGNRDSVFWLNGGIFAMNIASSALPDKPLIQSSEKFFYKFSVNPFNGDFLVSDALDYSRDGKLYFYNRKGDLLKTMTAGIIPGVAYYRTNEITVIN